MIIEKVPLRLIAYARSGDKGSTANIGVIAYTQEGFDYLKEHLRDDLVQNFFIALEPISTIRYELPNLWAFNFLLKGALGKGGASCSLRLDSQGKALGQALLQMSIEVPEEKLGKMLRMN